MSVRPRTEAYTLFGGDLCVWVLALWTALFLRDFTPPSFDLLLLHIAPFLLIFTLWAGVFFIFDLYKTPTLLGRKKVGRDLVNAQVVNTIIAIFFFYFIPFFIITPKTILFIHLVASFVGIAVWRLIIATRFRPTKKKEVLLIGKGPDVALLAHEINTNGRYRFSVDHREELQLEEVVRVIEEKNISTIIIDTHAPEVRGRTRELYELLFANVTFLDLHELFEEVFGRVPLTLLHDSWFVENITVTPKRFSDATKRLMDIVVGGIIGIITLPLYPFVIAAIYLEDQRAPFIKQTRVGKSFRPITLYKFRTMTRNEESVTGNGGDNRVTRVGAFLRKTRLDELPQLWNVLRGDLSLIGPRPELFDATRLYSEEIPYYLSRLLIVPGLSGWAQIYHQAHPHHAADIPETKNKLSYDLYYIKNHSLFLDIQIALKTLRTIASRSGR